jgi:hypothetical protein
VFATGPSKPGSARGGTAKMQGLCLRSLEQLHQASFVACGSLGQCCEGVDGPDSFFGSERVVDALLRGCGRPHQRVHVAPGVRSRTEMTESESW